MLNLEMSLKNVNDKYYVNDIEVSKEEYFDAVTVLDDYFKEQENKNQEYPDEFALDTLAHEIKVNPELISRLQTFNLLNDLGIADMLF